MVYYTSRTDSNNARDTARFTARFVPRVYRQGLVAAISSRECGGREHRWRLECVTHGVAVDYNFPNGVAPLAALHGKGRCMSIKSGLSIGQVKLTLSRAVSAYCSRAR